MKSLFKNISEKLKSLSNCQYTLGLTIFLGLVYYIYEYIYTPVKNTNPYIIRIKNYINTNTNNKNTNNKNTNTNNKEHFENGDKSDEYYGNNDDAVLVTFYSFDYCGYCKQFKPIWDEAQNKKYPMNVKFRYIVSNILSPNPELPNISLNKSSKFAPLKISS